MNLTPTFQDWNCADQRVFLRADLNIPLANGTISNDRRLQAILPTLDYLLAKQAQVFIGTHIGRPNGFEENLSTKQLILWFDQRGYSITFAKNPAAAKEMPLEPNTIIMLENLRFFAGEKQSTPSYVDELFSLADWYVLDAFGTLHRSDASLAPLAEKYPTDHRSVGFLVEKELSVLHSLRTNPKKPSCYILGGGKAADKIPLIESLIPVADNIVLCPALVFTFLKAQGQNVGKSLVDEDALSSVEEMLKNAQKNSTKIIFPLDYQIAQGSLEGPLSYCNADSIPEDAIGLSIGPKTIALIENTITASETVFYNGMMGLTNRQETLNGVKEVMKAMAKSHKTTIVAGGNSIDIIDQLGLTGITHIMTGGGSTLTYLAGKPLPALVPFLVNGTKSNEV